MVTPSLKRLQSTTSLFNRFLNSLIQKSFILDSLYLSSFLESQAKDLLAEIAPTWMNVSLKMKQDPETDKAFGWVLEMYAYAIASALHGVRHILRKDFMLQPPWDLETKNKYILHYTYGCDYNLKGELTYGKIGEWRFDKRLYLQGPIPKNLLLPRAWGS